MELDKLEISLRQRTPWEAIDLGFALARRWFMPLWLLWLSTAVPLGLVLFVFFYDQFWLLMLIIWWFKPLYEPALMFWLSRAVFGERLPIKTVLRQWWTVVRPQLLRNLTLRRFNPSRSFTLPVALLEGLQGKMRRNRLRVLSRHQHASVWLSVIGIHLEMVLQIAFMTTVFVLIPEDLRWVSFDDLFFAPGQLSDWLQFAGGLLCLSIIAPFYTAAGFALYLNRRSELEAWDIEISFRRMAERLKATTVAGLHRSLSVVLLVTTVGLMSGLTSSPAAAAQQVNPREAKSLIETVLEDKAFGRLEETHYWQYIGQPAEPEVTDNGFLDGLEAWFSRASDSLDGMAVMAKAMVWFVAMALLIFLLWQVIKQRRWLLGAQSRATAPDKEAPVALFGLDLRPDALPENPATAAHQLMQQGAYREALSLLYRGALVYLVTQSQLEIPDSATEGECEKLVSASQSARDAEYFSHLTLHWLRMAYGHMPPSEASLLSLCERWREVYGRVND
ncbi:hypothetical protein Q4488_02445 [Amphritea sp. 1_MG-2023]|uniref:DUF4129 domain-containing protein n=1 Tax=Amphritea sp. 1_MG-2023 TaxID=3062670 RepID=UPI0026E446E8|nr:hypothetical protein [Amphritea sp. 1_MG-2023]MDO6562232.1 hypothetical protein [Amphritea sp. 1_MG-2023]